MKTETRMYLADLTTWYNSSTTLDNIMECAESQGTVWTLQEFIEQFNNGEEPLCSMLADTEGNVVLKGAVFEDSEFICEVRDSIYRQE